MRVRRRSLNTPRNFKSLSSRFRRLRRTPLLSRSKKASLSPTRRDSREKEKLRRRGSDCSKKKKLSSKTRRKI